MQAAGDAAKRPKCLGSRCDQDGVGSARMPDGRTVTVGRAEFDALLGKRRKRAWFSIRKQAPMPARR
jgi:hypothetical protein